MSDQSTTTQDQNDIGLHLRTALQQIESVMSQPGTNVDLTGIRQSIAAALDLHGRSGLAATADYSATTGDSPAVTLPADPATDPAATGSQPPSGDDLAARGTDQAIQEAAPPAPDAEQVPDTAGQVDSSGTSEVNPPAG